MRRFRHTSVLGLALLGSLCCIVTYIHPAHAVSLASFATRIDGEERIATAEESIESSVAYVSLQHLVEQFGGGYNLLPTRMRIDLTGSTAWIQANDRRVNALSIFKLAHPILRVNGDFLIARKDVPRFFEEAFRLKVESRTSSEALRSSSSNLGSPNLLNIDGTSDARRTAGQDIRVLVIDPGHGGYDSGVVGNAALEEKTIVLDIASQCEALLKKRFDVQIIMTRREDTDLSLKQRSILVNSNQTDLLLSIHAGAAFSSKSEGFAIFYPDTPESALTRLVPKHLPNNRSLALQLEEALIEGTSLSSRGIHEAPSRLFGYVNAYGVLIEIATLTNPHDEALLQSTETKGRIAAAIVAGLESFMATGKQSKFSTPTDGIPSKNTLTLDNSSIEAPYVTDTKR